MPAFKIPLINTVPSVEFVIVSSFSKITPADPVTSKLVLAEIDPPFKVVNVPAAAEFAPITVPSTAPPSTSTLLISTSPVPSGVIAMFPLEPSVIIMDPVVEFPV